VIVCFVDTGIGGIDCHQCVNLLFIILIFYFLRICFLSFITARSFTGFDCIYV
jgi:hypothetical protein